MVEPFLQEIDAFLVTRGLSERQFGALALKDGKFVSELKSGTRSPTLKTVERVRHFMRSYRPETKQDAA